VRSGKHNAELSLAGDAMLFSKLFE